MIIVNILNKKWIYSTNKLKITKFNFENWITQLAYTY